MSDAQTFRASTVAVLHGGPSSEHDISVVTARGVIQSFRNAGHTALSVWVDRDGLWHFAGSDADAGVSVAAPKSVPAALATLAEGGVDQCFLAFHGTYGEDGRVQGALELAGIPYTGSGVTATALAMDKPLTRRVMASAGIAVPEAMEIAAARLTTIEGRKQTAEAIAGLLGTPVVVKVPAGGSSLGIEIPETVTALEDTLDRLRHDATLLLCERFVAGVELTAGVLARRDGSLEALPIVEIAPIGERFFDYEAKYDPSLTDEIVPARISAEVEQKCREIGLLAHNLLGCRAISRTDLILDADGKLWVLEINTLPGLTPASLLPKAAAAANCTYQQLLDRVVAASR